MFGLVILAPPELLAQSPALVIRGGTLISPSGISPTGAERLENAIIVIRGERIVEVGFAGEVALPPGATLVEARGKYILPGLIDGHVHFRDWSGELFLNHGVTSVLDIGDPTEWIMAVRDTVRAGLYRAPRIYASGNIIDGEAPRGEPRSAMGGGGPSGRSRGNRTVVRTEEEARQAVRQLHSAQADLVKVYQELSPQLLRSVTEEAHGLGLAVIGHTGDAFMAAEAGLDGITHLWGIAETLMPPEVRERHHHHEIACPYAWLDPNQASDLILKLVAANVYVNPLLINEHIGLTPLSERQEREVYQLFSDPRLSYVPLDAALGAQTFFAKVRNYASRWGRFPHLSDLPPEVQTDFQTGYEHARDFVAAFQRAGGKLVAGTDASGASVTPGLGLHHELELLVESGVSPLEALRAATLHPAQMAHIDDEVGSVEAGKYADLLILDADPLEDIRNTRRIWKLFLGGKEVELGYRDDFASPIPYPLEEYSSSYYTKPQLSLLSPPAAVVNSESIRIQIQGMGFHMRSRVDFNGRPVPFQFVDSQRLEAVIPAELLTRIGTFPVVVTNPRPGGDESAPRGFVVSPAASEKAR
ncbi:MAG: amidohydrolase family protein [Acidobacteriota bacterium]